MQVDLYTKDIPEIFERFRDTIGERHWIKRLAAIKSEIKGKPYLRDYLLEENAIAVVLDRCSDLASRYGRIPPQHTDDRSLYPALRLAAQTMWIVDRSSPKQAKGIFRRLHGAFKNPDDMRAIQFELGVATHFVRRGCSVSWPETERSGTFDLMIHGIGPDGLEVECKSVSRDRGRKIHKRDALEFNHLVRQRLEVPAHRLHSGLAVVLTLPDRLATGFRDRQTLAEQLGRVVIAGTGAALEDGSDVRVSEFDIREYPNIGAPESPTLRADVDKITGTQNREVMILGRRNGGALVFVMQSRQHDALLPYVFNSMGTLQETSCRSKEPAWCLLEWTGFQPTNS